MTFRWPVWVLVGLALVGCGGGGGSGSGGGTSISLSMSSVSFTAVEGEAAPAAAIVHVSYSGAAVVVGYAPGVPQPNWLTVVTQQGGGSNSVDFALTVSDTLTVGTRSTTVRFATGHTDGSDVEYADLPVTYTVTPSGLAISAAPSTVSFLAEAQGSAPPPQTVNVTFNGAQASVSGMPSWLTVTAPANPAASPAAFSLAVNTTAVAAGSVLSADIQFATANAGSSFQRTASVHVTYTVDQHFDATAPASTLSFSGVERSSQPPQPVAGYALTITGAQSHWHASTAQSWIKLSAASGTGAATVTVTADASVLSSGSYSGTVTVSDDVSGAVRTFPVTLVLHAPGLVITPATLTFSVDSLTPSSELTQTVTVSDELGGALSSAAAKWSLASISAPWVQWGPPSGTTSPASFATVTLSTTELSKLTAGPHTATIVLTYVDADGLSHTANVPLSLQLNAGYINYVAPYVGVQNLAGQLVVRGANFSIPGGALTVTVGSTTLGTVVPDSDTQLRVSYPALPAGRYPVHIQNAAGFDSRSADLLIVPPSGFTYAAITAPSVRRKILYDAERQTLYGVNEQGQEIESYTHTSGAWLTGSPYVLPQLTDLDLLPDGKSLVVLTQNAVDEIALDQTPWSAQTRASNPDSFCGRFLDHLAVANDGKVMIISNLMSCSGFTGSYLYDALNPGAGLVSNPYPIGQLYDGIVAGSADGSKLYSGSNGVSPGQPVMTFDALTDTLTDSANVDYNLSAVSVSGDASRVILQNVDVYSGALVITGQLPAGSGGVALASRDSSKAFVYRDDGASPRIEVYDLTLPLQTGGLYQLTKTVSLPDSPNATAGNYQAITLAQTPDGATVFVSGDSKILVVPVQ